MTKTILRIALFAALITAGLLAFAGVQKVQACGGFFCQNVPINQNAERIIFLMNEKEQKVSAIVGINYVGEAKDFSWVVPVPNKPEIDVTEQSTVDALDAGTSVSIQTPRNYCPEIQPFNGGFGGGGFGGGGGEFGSVGPYDYAIIQNDDAQALVKWLRDNGFRVTKEMEPYIDIYVKEKQYFVAFKLRRGLEITAIQPVKLTYQSTYASIPLRLTAIAAVDDMPVLVWIFGSTQYVPQNYAHAQIDFSAWRGAQRLTSSNIIPTSYFGNPFINYTRALKQIQTENKGQAFITEMARPTNYYNSRGNALDPTRFRTELTDIVKSYSYVTRLRAQLSASEMTKDPVFVAQPGLADVSEVIELDKKPELDPLLYWGCSSRTALSDAVRAALPAVRTHFDALNLDVRHPATWKKSEFKLAESETADFYAISPNAVTLETVQDFLANRNSTPIVLITKISLDELERTDFHRVFYDFGTDNKTLARLLLYKLKIEDTPDNIAKILIDKHATAVLRFNIGELSEAVLITLLAPPSNWNANGKVYDAMLAYIGSYQYYGRADWPHILLLSFQGFHPISFPDGWMEKTIDSDPAITLQKAENPDESPVFHISLFDTPGADMDGSYKNAMISRLEKRYGKATADQLFKQRLCETSGTFAKKLDFEYEGRKGVVVMLPFGVLGGYAPVAQYATHSKILNEMLDDILKQYRCN